MNAVTRKAPAKINLGLDIVGRRADGYHLLETVFQTVSVYDCLTVSHRTQAGISDVFGEKRAVRCHQSGVESGGGVLPCSGNHTAVSHRSGKAHSLTGWHGRRQYRCSSSAAGAAELTGVTLPQEQLLQIAVKLGADVPFSCTAERRMPPESARRWSSFRRVRCLIW